MTVVVAKIDTTATTGAGHNIIRNIEVCESIPADTDKYTYRQIRGLNHTAGPPAGSYYWPVGPGSAVDLTNDTYYDFDDNLVSLQFMAD